MSAIVTNSDARQLLDDLRSDPALGPAARFHLDEILGAADFAGDVPSLIDLIARATFSPHLLEPSLRDTIDDRSGLYRDVSLLGRLDYGTHLLALVKSHLREVWDPENRLTHLTTRAGAIVRTVQLPKIDTENAAAYRRELWRSVDPSDLYAPRPSA